MSSHIQGQVAKINGWLPKMDRYNRAIWEGKLKLVAESGEGTRSASVQVFVPFPEGTTIEQKIDDGMLDPVFHQILGILQGIFAECDGEVGVEPYTGGLHTRSFTLTFEKGKKK